MSAKQNPVKQYCPNCAEEAVREGDRIICTACDAIFKVTKTKGATVKAVGWFEDLEDRVTKLEAAHQPGPIPPTEPAEPAEPEEPEEPEDDDQAEDNIFPR